MKFIVAFFLFLFAFVNGYSQTDTSRVFNASTFNPRSDSVIERLVAMASVNPRVTSLESVATQYEYEFKRGKTAWLNNIQAAGNVNELSLKQGSAPTDPLIQSTQYPRYNVGVIIPLGLFINNGKQNKANYARYESMLDAVKIEKQNIRKEVITQYQNYILQKQLIALQQELLQDAKILLTKHEEDFRNDKITLETYTNTSRTYNNEQVKEINMQGGLKVIEAELEALIGMHIADALELIKGQLGYSK
jgi:outer membrane protein TolC